MNITQVTVSHTVIYDQANYIEWCKLGDWEPTDEGFLQWVRDCADEDFNGGIYFDQHVLEY